MLAARACREDVIVAGLQPVDHAGACRIDVGELTFEHEGTDDEVVVRMHVVAATCAVEYLVAENADRTEAWSSGLIFMEVETGRSRDEAVGMTGDIGRSRSIGPDEVVPTFRFANDE